MLTNLKNSRFIHMICDQINRMPPALVGFITIFSCIVGTALFCILGTAALLALIIVFMYFTVFTTMIPLGIGVATAGWAFHAGMWRKQNTQLSTSYIFKQTAKMWSLSIVLGCVALVLFPLGRDTLLISLSFSSNPNGSVLGVYIPVAGWLVIGASKIIALLKSTPTILTSIKRELTQTGLNSMKKCAELDFSRSKV